MATSLAPLFRRSVGFDHFDDLFDGVLRGDTGFSYPPYDIVRDDANGYQLIMAVAGFTDKDIDITAQNGKLTISGKWQKDAEAGKDQREWLHRGIARRAFERVFRLADHVEVTSAELKDGLLTVSLQQIIPEAEKPHRVHIKTR